MSAEAALGPLTTCPAKALGARTGATGQADQRSVPHLPDACGDKLDQASRGRQKKQCGGDDHAEQCAGENVPGIVGADIHSRERQNRREREQDCAQGAVIQPDAEGEGEPANSMVAGEVQLG